jgi:GNAT superfamily N-acetyltransferase
MSIEIHHAETGDDIARLLPVIRELRPKLKDAAELVQRVQRQQGQGYRLIYAINDKGEPVACAGFRLIENLSAGRSLYVDDLICLEAWRGCGFAKALMRWMEQFARDEGCETFHLDSGTQRERAHHFYFREGLSITSFHFVKKLEG